MCCTGQNLRRLKRSLPNPTVGPLPCSIAIEWRPPRDPQVQTPLPMAANARQWEHCERHVSRPIFLGAEGWAGRVASERLSLIITRWVTGLCGNGAVVLSSRQRSMMSVTCTLFERSPEQWRRVELSGPAPVRFDLAAEHCNAEGRMYALGRLAQLVRAAGLQPAGRGFESLSAHSVVDLTTLSLLMCKSRVSSLRHVCFLIQTLGVTDAQ
jgi:hypothetical protein